MLPIAIARYLNATVPDVDYDETGVTGNTFIAVMPSAPDLAVSITPSGGIPWEGHGSLPTDEPTIQIRVRSERFDPRPGLQLAEQIYRQMVGLHGQAIDAGGDAEHYIHRCLAMQTGPTSIGRDENDRPEFTLNFALRVRALSVHRST